MNKYFLIFLMLVVPFSLHAQNSIQVYVSPPSDNSTNVVVSNPQILTTMPFNTTGTGWAAAPPTGTTIANLGKYYTLSGSSSVVSDNDYGAGTGSYLGISASSKVGLKFNEDKNYFGFTWCAGDVGNQIQVYHAGQLLLTYTTSNVMDFLPKTPNKVITATDNSTYNSSAYYGKFTNRSMDANEPYAYLHLYSSGTMVFDSLVFSQAAGNGTFETDNHSVVSGLLTNLPGTWTTVYEAAAGTASSDQIFCNGNTPSNITLTGSVGSIQWQVSTNKMDWTNISGATSAILSGSQMGMLTQTRYYRAAATSGSTSAYSNTITVTVNPPSFVAATRFVSDLVVEGTGMKWYASAKGGSALLNTVVLQNGQHYYASQTINGVESEDRLDVTATLDLTPCAPTGLAVQTFGAGITVAGLQATGSNIRWYEASSGGTQLSNSTVLVNGAHYFATQNIDCTESATRLEVAVILN